MRNDVAHFDLQAAVGEGDLPDFDGGGSEHENRADQEHSEHDAFEVNTVALCKHDHDDGEYKDDDRAEQHYERCPGEYVAAVEDGDLEHELLATGVGEFGGAAFGNGEAYAVCETGVLVVDAEDQRSARGYHNYRRDGGADELQEGGRSIGVHI